MTTERSHRDAIYLDYQATTPVDPRVVEAMRPALEGLFGNPASRSHPFGRDARSAVDRARRQVAELLGARPAELVFTSGATEAANLALVGVTRAYASRGRHLVVSAADHRAVVDTARWLEGEGAEVTWLAPDATGAVHADDVARAVRDDTVLVAAMWANNEVGTLSPVREIGAVCRERGVLFFSDATQAVGKLPIDLERDPVDLLCLSAHKLYGPKGVGALYVRRRDPRVRLEPLIHGGGHERGLRSGTLNVPGILGLGAACELAARELAAEAERTARLRDRLESRIVAALDDVRQNGDRERRLPGCLNLSFAGLEAEDLMLSLDGVAVSSGSACSSESLEPSHVLRAMGVGEGWIRGSLRFGIGRPTTEAEVDEAARRVVAAVERLRGA